ncbi:50S ribosomal protein L21e [Candidatus Pacearchaeota archaeon]|nr:50S ribosomal protein L21e [Candidatus Pacearchaeota archaeon]
MLKQKLVREKGKIRLSHYFQEFKEGDRVTVVKELSIPSSFPTQLQGRSGVVRGKRGNFYVVTIKSNTKEKTYIIHSVHLRRLK